MSFWIVFVLTVKFGIYFLILKILKNACRTGPIAPSVKTLSKGPVENLTVSHLLKAKSPGRLGRFQEFSGAPSSNPHGCTGGAPSCTNHVGEYCPSVPSALKGEVGLLLPLRHWVAFTELRVERLCFVGRVCVWARLASVPIAWAGGAVVSHVWVAKRSASAHEFRQNEKPVFSGEVQGVGSIFEGELLQTIQDKLATLNAQNQPHARKVSANTHNVFCCAHTTALPGKVFPPKGEPLPPSAWGL